MKGFLPTKACRFAEWSWPGMSRWNTGLLKLKCAAWGFQSHWCSSGSQVAFALRCASQGCFYILAAGFWHAPGEHAALRPGLWSWKSVHPTSELPRCSSFFSGERLLRSGYVRTSKSLSARAWVWKAQVGPKTSTREPLGQDPGCGGSSRVLVQRKESRISRGISMVRISP